MGRLRLYNTPEERNNAEKVYKHRSYLKNKKRNRDIYRISALRTYYRRKVSGLCPLSPSGRSNILSLEALTKIEDKIEELTIELERLRNAKTN